MDGFYNFTDVQVASSILFCIFFAGLCCGALFSDGTAFIIKHILKKRKHDEDSNSL